MRRRQLCYPSLAGMFVIVALLTRAPAGECEGLAEIKVGGFAVDRLPLFQCLWLLAKELESNEVGTPVIALEAVPLWEFEWGTIDDGSSGSPTTELVARPSKWFPPISVSLTDSTLEQVVDALILEDGNHDWTYDEANNVINVVPRAVKHNPAWYLNRPVTNVWVYAGESLENLTRIAKENRIPFHVTSEWEQTARRVQPEDRCLEVYAFREVVNYCLAREAPAEQRFFLIASTTSPDERRVFTPAAGSTGRCVLSPPVRNGFAELLEEFRYR